MLVPQIAVKIDGGFSHHPVRSDDVAPNVDPSRIGEDGPWVIDRGDNSVA